VNAAARSRDVVSEERKGESLGYQFFLQRAAAIYRSGGICPGCKKGGVFRNGDRYSRRLGIGLRVKDSEHRKGKPEEDSATGRLRR